MTTPRHEMTIDGIDYTLKEFAFDEGMQLMIELSAIAGDGAKRAVMTFMSGQGNGQDIPPAIISGISDLSRSLIGAGGAEYLNKLLSQVTAMVPVEGGKPTSMRLSSKAVRDRLWVGAKGYSPALKVIGWALMENFGPFLMEKVEELKRLSGVFEEKAKSLLSADKPESE